MLLLKTTFSKNFKFVFFVHFNFFPILCINKMLQYQILCFLQSCHAYDNKKISLSLINA